MTNQSSTTQEEIDEVCELCEWNKLLWLTQLFRNCNSMMGLNSVLPKSAPNAQVN